MTIHRASTFSVALGISALLALVTLVLLQLWRPSTPLLRVSVEQLATAPEGALLLEGWLQLEQEQRYTRTYSILGKLQTEVLRVVPLTGQSWQPTNEVPALAILRSETSSRFFQGPAVNLGPLDPTWRAPFTVSKEAALIELMSAQPPAWWLALGGFALMVFLALAIRGIIKRARA
jgi:hypothetical protein